MTVLGDAWVKIQPDLSEFSAKVQTGVGEAMKSAQAEAQVQADQLAAAEDRLAVAQQRQAAASTQAADAQARLIAAQREAAAAAEAAAAGQDADAGAASRNAEAQARLEAAQARVDATALRARGSAREVAGAENDVAAASGRAAEAHGRSSGALQGMANVGGPLLLGLAGGVAAVSYGSIKLASDFQQATTELVTGAGESEQAIGMVRQGILNMAGDVAQTPMALAQGMFMIESAGYRGAAGLNVLRVAAEGAKVGGADLETTANALTTVMGDYHLSANQAADAQNFLTSVVQQGKTHMQDLAGSLSTILPVASNLGVPLKDVGGAMATMTSRGIDANRAATALRFEISQLADESPKGRNALEEVGLSAARVHDDLKTKGLIGTLQEITDMVGRKFPAGSAQYDSAMADISGGTRGLLGVLSTTGQNMDTFIGSAGRIASQMDENHGKVMGWEQAQRDLNTRLDQAKATGESLGITIGNALIPKVVTLMGAVQDSVGWFEHHREVAEALGAALGTVATVFIGAYLINAFSRMITSVSTAADTVGTFVTRLLFGAEVEQAGTAVEGMGARASVTGAQVSAAGGEATAAGGEFSAMGAEATAAAGELTAMGDAAVVAGGEVGAGGLAGEAGVAGEAVGGPAGLLGRSGGLIGFLTNPWVAGLAIAGGAVGGLTYEFLHMDDQMNDVRNDAGTTSKNVDALGQSLDDTGRKARESGLDSFTIHIRDLDDSLKPLADRFGWTSGALDLFAQQFHIDLRSMSADDAANVIRQKLQGLIDTTKDPAVANWARQSIDSLNQFQLSSGNLTAVNLKMYDLTNTFGLSSKQISDFATQSNINLSNLSHNDAMNQIVLHLIDVAQHAQDPSVRRWAQDALNNFTSAKNSAQANLPLISSALDGVSQHATSDIPGIQSFFQHVVTGWGDAQRQSVPFAQGAQRLFDEWTGNVVQDGQTAGQGFPGNLNAGLNAGKPATQGNVGDYLHMFTGAPPVAGGAGTDTGNAFAANAQQALAVRYGSFSDEVKRYDAALNQGLDPIAAAVAAIGPTALLPGKLAEGLAAGGPVDKATLFIAGEAGGETVISHDPQYRSANIGYWADAGRALGIPGFQTGGFTDPSQVPKPPPLTPEFGIVPQSFGVQGQSYINAEYKAVVKIASDRQAQLAAVSSGGGDPFGGGPVKAYMLAEVAKRWPGLAEASAFDYLEMREAGYNPNAANPTSDARGLAQNISGWGPGYEPGNVQQQTAWMLNYIAGRYGDPINAAAHERSAGWYDLGGDLMPGLNFALNTTGGAETVIPAGAGEVMGSLSGILAAVERLVGAALGGPGGPAGISGPGGAAGAPAAAVDLSRSLVVQGSADAATVADLQALMAQDQGVIEQTLQRELANWGFRPTPTPGTS